MTEYQPFESGSWRGMRREGFAVPGGNLDAWLERLAVTASRKTASRWIATPAEDNPWFVKVFTAASEHDSLFNRLKWQIRSSRSLHVWRISLKLQNAGFGCPEIQLAARKRTWRPFGWPTDALVMSPVEGQMVQTLLQTSDTEKVLDTVASELARFHMAGFAHGDCIPGNLFLQTDGHLAFIDNDRTMKISSWDRAPRVRRNLVQFVFHLLRKNCVLRKNAQKFLLIYAQCVRWTQSQADRELSRIWQWVDRRLATELSK
ncbi:MAG: hypothetical protein IKR13_05850 [Victivallales bacterium]|nr:hypothetical protein [Victivallales bacterium]